MTFTENQDAVSRSELLTSEQAAKVLAISQRKLWSLKANGEIPVVRIGRLVRFDAADLQDFIGRAKILDE